MVAAVNGKQAKRLRREAAKETKGLPEWSLRRLTRVLKKARKRGQRLILVD